MRNVLWRPDEDQVLLEMGQRGCGSHEISQAVGRTMSAVRSRAKKLSQGIGGRKSGKWERLVHDLDVNTWSEADRIGAWADVPQQLAELVVHVCRERKLPVKRVRSITRDPECIGCGWEIARQARAMGYSYPTIGRALNRDHTSIIHAINSSTQSTGTGRADQIPSEVYPSEWNEARTLVAA